MTEIAIILIGFTADTLLGDPRLLPHPIRLFGRAISLMEQSLNKGESRRLKGATMWFVLVVSTLLLFAFAERLAAPHPTAYILFSSLFFFYGLANSSLIREVWRVETIVRRGDITRSRLQLATIVGRDTQHLSITQIRTALVETLAENLSDGVIAPLFFYGLGGIPAMMAYKMVNTLDSMVGYKSDRFREFGYFSARMDDVANFIPARLTAVLMAAVTLSGRALTFIFKYGNSHSSPNAGYPEAAIAGILNCRLGGDNLYGGVEVRKPFIGERAREILHKDIITAAAVNMAVATVAVAILVLSKVWFG